MTSHDAFLSRSPAGQLLAVSSGPFNVDAPQNKVSPVSLLCTGSHLRTFSVSSSLCMEETAPAVPDHPGQT